MKLNQRQLDALGHIVDHCQKANLLAARLGTLERLEAEWETRYAIVRCVEVIGEATSRLGPQFERQHPGVPWRLIAGMRNRLIHGYDGIDLDLLWETVTEDIPKLLPAVGRSCALSSLRRSGRVTTPAVQPVSSHTRARGEDETRPS